MAGSETLSLKITQASLSQVANKPQWNMANIYKAIEQAVEEGSDILAFEELTLTGYEANDDFQYSDNKQTLELLNNIATYARELDPNLIISIGHPWRLQKRDIAGPQGAAFERSKNPLYDRLNLPFNVQTIISAGQVQGMTAKANLFNDERGYEKRYFNEWSMEAANAMGGKYGTIDIALDDEGKQKIPFGRPIIHVTDGKLKINIAQAICEEKWVASKYDGYPHDDSRYQSDNIIPSISKHLGSKDGLVLLTANASPPARDKNDKHTHLNSLNSNYADVVIDTDGVGSSGSTFYQFGGRQIAQNGQVIAQSPRLELDRVNSFTSVIEVKSAPEESAAKTHINLSHEFQNKAEPPLTLLAYEHEEAHAWDNPNNPDRHYEEVIRYTAAWLFDYIRKSGSGRGGVMEALSGGADSAFNSTMVAVMVNMGMKQLGVEKFCDDLKLKNKAEILAAEQSGGLEAAIQECLKSFLTAIYMGTNNSSDETKDAARLLIEGGVDPISGDNVKGIGGKFINRNVQDLLDFYGLAYAVENTSALKPSYKQKMMADVAEFLNLNPYDTTQKDRDDKAKVLRAKYPEIEQLVTAADGVAYENIQARGRQVLVMLFANMEGKIAVANPNLDEARNAYATFGGDLHSGTINLNTHLPKQYQLGIMKYLYEKGVHGVMDPVKSLGAVLKNKPSAELQPKNEAGEVVQHDEDALQRSFAQMDAISEYMLYKKVWTPNGERLLNAQEVFECCQRDPLFKGVDDNTLYNMVRLSYVRWQISQHKIHAGPIGPTFGRNVDHQTSKRTPNICGFHMDELTLLGVDLLFKKAQVAGKNWSTVDRKLIEKRAQQDEIFIDRFALMIRARGGNKDYDLDQLYGEIDQKGWDGVFTSLPAKHPLRVIHEASLN